MATRVASEAVIWKGLTLPLDNDPTDPVLGPTVGDIWVDTTANLVKRLVSNLPDVWVSIEGGSSPTVNPMTIYHVVSSNGTNAANIKSSSATLYGWSIFNNAAYPVFIKLFNKSTAPIPGTDSPAMTISVQAGVRADGDIDAGIAYPQGLGIAITKGITDLDSSTIAASDCVVDLFYL